MLSRKPRNNLYGPRGRGVERRLASGAVLPLVAFSLLLVVAYVGLAVDLMRNALTARKLQFSAQSAALYGLSYAVNQDGSFTASQSRENITAAVVAAGDNGGSAAFNEAPAGPADDGTARSKVSFATSDVSFVNNPNSNDAGEFFVQVKARRDGGDALKVFFLPALYAMNLITGDPMPDGVNSVSPYRVAEVLGQPASRIGDGAPRNSPVGTREFDLSGFAVLPLALSNQQFAQAANPAETRTAYDVDLVSSTDPAYTQPAQAGHIKACLVNVAASGQTSQYYGDAQGNNAIDELRNLLSYFANGAGARSPGVVERGSRLNAFDPDDPVFQTRKADVVLSAGQVPLGRSYIVPVIRQDPTFGQTQEVIGFARLKLVQAVAVGGGDLAFRFEMLESVPVRNAAFANGLATIPGTTGSLLPRPVYPFTERASIAGGGMETRPRGVALAPAISPRVIAQIN